MAWEFEMVAGPFNPRLTEGPAWEGQALLFTHIPASRILRYDPQTGACTVFREHTNHTNGLAFDAEGRLYGCCSGDGPLCALKPMAPRPPSWTAWMACPSTPPTIWRSTVRAGYGLATLGTRSTSTPVSARCWTITRSSGPIRSPTVPGRAGA